MYDKGMCGEGECEQNIPADAASIKTLAARSKDSNPR